MPYLSYTRRLLSLLALVWLVTACAGERYGETPTMPGGDPDQGREAIVRYGCGACHVIPGIAVADGMVGPPLTGWARRHFIAGNLANTPDNLIYWLRYPQTVEPGTAMPNLGVTDIDARNMGAYLYTLRAIR